MKPTTTRRTLTAAAAALTAGAALLPGTTAAANPNGEYVAFGDSFVANPGATDEANGTGRPGHVCPVSTTNVGHNVAAQLDMTLHDYTCNGTVAYVPTTPKQLGGYVDTAINNGHVNHNTKLITIAIGANDAMQAFWAPNEIQDDMYHQAVTGTINRLKEHAPNARVMVIGMPEIISRDGEHYMCPVNVFGNAPRVPAAPARIFEDNLQARQARAAEATGATFINLKDVSNVDAAMCGPDGERHVSAFVDSDTANYNMPNHLTHHGSRVVATQVADAYRG
ncbi:GDSL-type esterase/lipase family protein [Corynebacterium freneyi]|uniref:GDSL-type esterase/lipase family protein n=1 Tax=Corynebacterium freneyi TaxID=134034 RepID=UPI00254EAC45|nr:GDSL-type esterase/lipase family protein [Corynebacterium freneyi]MDK8768577.1 GDSL-type esterase/lipase family protein [Corynebacterium freneyi]